MYDLDNSTLTLSQNSSINYHKMCDSLIDELIKIRNKSSIQELSNSEKESILLVHNVLKQSNGGKLEYI